MGTHRLTAHPDFAPAMVRGVDVQWTDPGTGTLYLRYRVNGHEALVIPPFAGLGRADELWTTTCFELYVATIGETEYVEFNFSPSRRWAAYHFDDYREGRTDLPMAAEPTSEIDVGDRFLVQQVQLDASVLPPGPWAIGLSAIIEETEGAKSFWALAHPPGRPDFHHPACFAAGLEPPPAT